MKKYYIKTSLMFLFGSPIALGIIVYSRLIPHLLVLLVVILKKFSTFVSEGNIPVKASRIFMPIFLIYCFQISAAIIIDLARALLKRENEISFWSTRFPPLSSDDILPEFTTYRVEALLDNGFEKTSECISIYISCEFLDVFKNPVITGMYEDKLYFLNPLGAGEKYTDIRRIVRSYSNRRDPSEFIEKRIRGTSIYVANGLCYLNEKAQLPQTFDYYEFINNYFSSGMGAFGIIESSDLSVQYEAVRHDYFDYAFILNFDLSGIDTADFHCFLGFKKLETEIPFYPWQYYSSFEDIYLNIQYFNYQYFFVSPSYDFLGTKSLYDSPFPYNVDKLAIENLISSIAIESWE